MQNNQNKHIPTQQVFLPIHNIQFLSGERLIFFCIMKKIIKIGIGLLIIGIIAGTLGYVFIYNKPHRNFEKASPDFNLSAFELFDAYISDRNMAETKYNGKVIQLNGKIQKTEKVDSIVIGVFVFQEGLFGDEGIRCTMLPKFNDEILKVKPETSVLIKGFCTGYNDTDVILEKCTLIQ